jgi:hypothetical protein
MEHRLPTSFVAIVAALTLSGSVVTASTPAQTAGRTATAHAAARCDSDEATDTEAAMPPKANKGKADKAHGKAHAQEQGEQGETESGDHQRKQNHGWYVSQAALDQSVSGHDHGQAVAAIARGNAGKPEAADK